MIVGQLFSFLLASDCIQGSCRIEWCTGTARGGQVWNLKVANTSKRVIPVWLLLVFCVSLKVAYVSVTRFGADVDILKHFGEYMSTENGGFVLQHLQFDQKRTNFVKVSEVILMSASH